MQLLIAGTSEGNWLILSYVNVGGAEDLLGVKRGTCWVVDGILLTFTVYIAGDVYFYLLVACMKQSWN